MPYRRLSLYNGDLVKGDKVVMRVVQENHLHRLLRDK